MAKPTMILPEGRQRYFNNDGTPAAGALLYTYAAGTTNPKETYTDADGTTPHPNPIQLDEKGEAVIHWDGAYKVDLKQADGQQVTGYPVDNLRTDPANLWTLFQQLAAGAGASLLGFLASGSAFVRTVQDKLRDSVAVTDYGAVGDGLTDSSSAVQKALNTGKNVRFTPGVYLLAAATYGKSRQSIILEAGAIVKVTAAVRAAFHFIDRSNCAVRGEGTLDCNSLATSGVLFQSDQLRATDLRVEGITIMRTKADPTLQYGGVEVSSTGGAGGTRSKRATIRGVSLLDTGSHGAIAAYCDGVKFQDNFIDGAACHGFEAVDCTRVVETGNEVNNCLISGLGVGTHTTFWTIADNIITNCAGDGSITCEHNSNYGTIKNNTIIDANTSGINVSYGTSGGTLAPFDKVQDVTVSGNVVRCKVGLTTKIGLNCYSSTGDGLGQGIKVSGNTFDGFNIGISFRYVDACSVVDNTIRNLTGVNAVAIQAALATRTIIKGNVSEDATGDHAIQLLDYAGLSCNKCTISGNTVHSSGVDASKAMVYIEGDGTHVVKGNATGGSTHYVQAPAAVVLMEGNDGNLSVSPYLGPKITALGNGNSSQDILTLGGRRIVIGTAPPTTGQWLRGDRCFNIDPQVGAPKSWACTVGGLDAAAVWVSEGNL